MLRTQEKQERLLEKLKRELGDYILKALADDDVMEIMLNPDGRLDLNYQIRFVKFLQKKQGLSDELIMSMHHEMQAMHGRQFEMDEEQINPPPCKFAINC